MLQIPQAFYKICLTPCLAKVNLISSKSLPIVPLKGIAGTAARSHQTFLGASSGHAIERNSPQSREAAQRCHKIVKRQGVAG